MSLSDLSSPTAVSQALDEYDQVGQDAFLARYGFRVARTYFVLRDGQAYDSKAIAGAAHGHQFGTPLQASEFSGGEATVAAKLEELGFEVTRREPGWHYTIGDIATRADIHGTYGGATYGGIEPSGKTPNVMIYTDPKQGALNGYDYDGWDGNDPSVFYYTGEGRHGDQELREGNKAILNHEADGRTLRLFEAVDEPARAGGKRQRYVGAFYVDAADPFRYASAPDASGSRRQVLVFRLVRSGETPQPGPAAPPATGPEAEPALLTNAPQADDEPTEASDDHPDYMGDAEVTLVPSEQNTAEEFELQPQAGRIARRDEARLVSQFEHWLGQQGFETHRLRIKIPGERHELVTDTYDATHAVLYEAKSKSDRATVRLAIGQLLDYLRFSPNTTGRILLPDEPAPDVQRLIRACGFGLAYRKLGAWTVLDGNGHAV